MLFSIYDFFSFEEIILYNFILSILSAYNILTNKSTLLYMLLYILRYTYI